MVDGCTPHLAGNHCLAQAMVMKASDLVSLSFGQLLVSPALLLKSGNYLAIRRSDLFGLPPGGT